MEVLPVSFWKKDGGGSRRTEGLRLLGRWQQLVAVLWGFCRDEKLACCQWGPGKVRSAQESKETVGLQGVGKY